jgi:acetyl-CoA carboxylase carboxyl transferase subunit beta
MEGRPLKDETESALSNVNSNGAHPDGLVKALPQNLAVKCPNCREVLVGKDWEKNLRVCNRCGHHFRLSASERIELLVDEGSFEEFAADLTPGDPLAFVSRSQSYRSKLDAESANTGLTEAVIVGHGRIEGMPLVIVAMDFRFIGGSMGTVVGEKITRAIETAADERTPLLICSASGGARMQEGLLSLMQMAKTSAALGHLADVGAPYFSLLTDPTTGGVSASFAFLGDVILAEPGALIGFAGPRVIEQAIHQKLPKDTNTADFVRAHGMIDDIVHRRDLRAVLARLLRIYGQCAEAVEAEPETGAHE